MAMYTDPQSANYPDKAAYDIVQAQRNMQNQAMQANPAIAAAVSRNFQPQFQQGLFGQQQQFQQQRPASLLQAYMARNRSPMFSGMAGQMGPGNAPAQFRPMRQPFMSQMPERSAFPAGTVPPTMPSPTIRPDIIQPTLNQERGGYTTERIAQAIRQGMQDTPGASLVDTARKAVSAYGVSEEQAIAAARMAAAGGGGGAFDIGTNYIAPSADFGPAPRYIPPPAAGNVAAPKPTTQPAYGTPEYYDWLLSQGQSYNVNY